MTLKFIDLQSHDDESSLAYTVTFDDSGCGPAHDGDGIRSRFFEAAAYPDCEAIGVEPRARGALHSEKYDTEDMVGMIKKYIRAEANRENGE